MENEEMNTTPQADNTAQQAKTFTQAEVDEIIAKRLAREKKTAEAAGSLKEAELAKRELELDVKTALIDNNLPKELAQIIRADSAEDITGIIDTLKKYIKPEKEKADSAGGFRIGASNDNNTENGAVDPYRRVMGLARRDS